MASEFQVLPAIDLRGGRVVRLREGDFARETAYSDDPMGVARSFVEAGARWIHIVDLDGARAGEPVQADIIRAVVEAVGDRAACQVAGGLRTEASVAAALLAGAARVVVGTAALQDPRFAGRIVATHGTGAIVVALDVRDGLALGEGWREGAAGVPAEAALDRLAAEGVTTFAATAIDRDGLLQGPHLDLLGRLVALDRGRVIASGGVSSVDDLRAVRDVGCSGAIIGRALYEGRISLEDALSAVE